MTNDEILKHIDHTELRAFAKREDIYNLCIDAIKYKTASVCIPPSYVKYVREEFGNDVNICTVIGFPLGYNTTAVKVFETEQAIKDGADEIDMVVNISNVKNWLWDEVTDEIGQIKAAAGDKILKVIIETCYLTEDEKIMLCKCVTKAGADFIKTSTGFGTGGAKIEDINLFKDNIGENVRMKAAGGVKSKADLEMFIEAGCDRIGTSSAVKILMGNDTPDTY